MKTAELAELIKGRRSIRNWQSKAVDDKILVEAIELAAYAPNGGNQQNWRFYVIVKPQTLQSIADAVQASGDLMNSWREPPKAGEAPRTPPRASFFRAAPAAIAIAASAYNSPADQILATKGKSDPKALEMQRWRETADTRIQSVSSAIAYLLLILHQMGLGSVWMTGPMQAKGEIEKILKVPKGLDLIAYLPVGYAAESPALRERKPVMDVCEIVK
jgi:nitroreductase